VEGGIAMSNTFWEPAFKEKECGWDYTTSFGNLLVRGEVEGGII
jgi:hypothetical protein